MTTQGLDVQVSAPGAQQAAAQIGGVSRSVGNLSRGIGGLLSPLLGANVLTTLLGGSLVGMSLQGGAARSAIDSLVDSVEELFDPIGELLIRFSDWFAEQSAITQASLLAIPAILGVATSMRILGINLLALLANPVVLGIVAIAAGLYILYTRSEEFRESANNAFGLFAAAVAKAKDDLQPLISAVEFLIERLRELQQILDIRLGDVPVIGGALEAVGIGDIEARQLLPPPVRYGLDVLSNPDTFTLNPERDLLDDFLGSSTRNRTPFPAQGDIVQNYYGVDSDYIDNEIAKRFNDPNTQSRLRGGP